jgi:glycosyltransferase involved in cell wall biosynthesis
VTDGDLEHLGELARGSGLRRVAIVAWRDLGDPEAGGSELHAHEVARRWAAAGIDVVMRTSSVAGEPVRIERDGYTSIRRSGRYQVFRSAPTDIVRGRLGDLDGLVEIWNGMPFFSPLWARASHRLPRVTWLHHVHAEMWQMVLPPRLAAIGTAIESRIAPPIYRRSQLVTLSGSSREEIVELLGLRRERVSVVAPGVDTRYSPAGEKSDTPLVVAVGRLVPVKRFDRLLRAMAEVHETRPDVECTIIGEGMERGRLEALRDELGAASYVHLPGRLSEEQLLDVYRRAWVLASTSVREGWGMTVSEAAACGTPAVVSRIAGHSDVVIDGQTGYLASSRDEMVGRLRELVRDEGLRERFSKAALDRAADLTWEATAAGTLEVLAREATRIRSGWARPAN